MVTFFKKGASLVIAVQSENNLNQETIEKLTWLFDGAKALKSKHLKGQYIGPRREMITPWSTNAVEITQNMGIEGITRIENMPSLTTKSQHSTKCCNVFMTDLLPTFSTSPTNRNKSYISTTLKNTTNKKVLHYPTKKSNIFATYRQKLVVN